MGKFYVPPEPWALYMLAYVTRDSVGAILPAATVKVFRATSPYLFMGEQVSDSGGNYSFAFLEPGPFFVASWKALDTWDDETETLDNEMGTLDEVLQSAGVTVDYLIAVRP